MPVNGTISGNSDFIVTNKEFLSSAKDFGWLIKKPEDVGLYSQEVDQLMDFLKLPFFNTQLPGNVRPFNPRGNVGDLCWGVSSWEDLLKSLFKTPFE